ncbi:MAG: sensor histidine kinase [Oscillospiraceae bacterium]
MRKFDKGQNKNAINPQGFIARMRNKIGNWPMKKKLLFIVLSGLMIMSIISFVSLKIYDDAYKELLYHSLEESLSYSSKEISSYLMRVEKLSTLILADDSVQSNMMTIKYEDTSTLKAMTANQNLRSIIGSYYQSYSDGILRCISIYTKDGLLSSNIQRAKEVPENIGEVMQGKSETSRGAPIWITDDVPTYGVFLGRTINEITSYKQESMGNMLLQIDLSRLVKQATKFQGQYENVAYVIRDENKILYHTEGFDEENIAALGDVGEWDYKIISFSGKPYFVVQGEIDTYGWTYYCVVSYANIAQKILQAKQLSMLVIILLSIFVALLSNRLVDTITVHVRRLMRKMDAFAKDSTKIPQADYNYATRTDEFGVLHQQFDWMSSQVIDLNWRNYTSELLRQQAQIKALEHQMNPHFLYNTLDSIRWRAKVAGETDIYKMVEELSVLLRASLSYQDGQDSTLGEELKTINAYLEIEKFRYGERLVVENSIKDEYLHACIPKLTLQPLVENAIYYSVEKNIGECEIVLMAERKEKKLFIYVKNTGSEMEEGLLEKLENGEVKVNGHGIGLLNIHKRLQLQFGGEYGLSLYNVDDYAVAQVVIPFAFQEGNITL